MNKRATITRTRLSKILDIAPDLKQILLMEDISLEEKRMKIKYFLSDQLNSIFVDNPSIPPLEWILVRNAAAVLQSILSPRSERLAGYSMLQYLDDQLHCRRSQDAPSPRPGFWTELAHLLRGITGQAGIYSDKVPAFLKYEGRRAAVLRSADLSRMAKASDKHRDVYPDGLDEESISRRNKNRHRILSYFNASANDWDDWEWHIRHIIRDAGTLSELVQLSEAEHRSIQMARQSRIPFGITPYYLSLIDHSPGPGRDMAVRAQVIPPAEYVEGMKAHKACAEKSLDFMLEKDTSPIRGITRRYPMIVILKPILTCPQICVYCQRNWEIEDVHAPNAVVNEKTIDKAIEWIARTPEIIEVLITGGDPLLMADDRIIDIMDRLSRIDHVERIRLGTRTPVTLPQRVTDDLVESISRYHVPGKREILIVTHFEDLYEVTPDSMQAVQKFRRKGMDIYNQLVYTFYNSRKFQVAHLRNKLRLIGVTPYYTFNTKGKDETDLYRVPIARLLQEQHEEARLFPGTVRTDEIVFNVPRLGKNYLRASQHHDIISILPDGRRVYEFHPWEKKLELMDTYVYTDVSIYDYLKRLKSIGEDISPYRTIWHYY